MIIRINEPKPMEQSYNGEMYGKTVSAPGSQITTSNNKKLVVKKEKAKRKNSEKRKEKSRKAARERRSQEAKIFDEIEEILPVSSKILDHLDKASLVRIAINYIKIRSIVEPFQIPNIADSFDLGSLLNTLNGFMLVLSKNGDMIYLSDNVERFLGLNQIDLIGQSIYDYSHPCDHGDIKSFLEPLINASKSEMIKQLNDVISDNFGPYFIRMKCTLTNKGRNLNLKSANYKVIKFRGRMIDLEMVNPKHAQMISESYHHYMIVVAELIQHPIRIEIPLKGDVFVSKHLPDMKFVYVDESIKELFGYNVNDLIGTSFYQYFDGNDFTQLSILFKTLFAKGQCDFGKYKFLAKTGGYRWISTQATIINEPNSSQPQSIILINRIISNIEDAHLLTSAVQTNASVVTHVSLPTIISTPLLNYSEVSTTSSIIKAKRLESGSCLSELSHATTFVPNINTSLLNTLKVKQKEEQKELLVELCQPQSNIENFISSTETVLAPKTADMESGFLVFTEDNKGLTVLNDADDLTHLAPDAGDLCVPMLPDMDFTDMNLFDEIFLNSSSYNITTSGMLSEDEFLNNLASLDSDKSKLDSPDNFNLEFDNNLKKFANENFFGISNKDLKSNDFDQTYPLDVNSNDPFLSFTNSNEFFISNSPATRSDSSINDSFTSNSPMNSSSSSLQFSPQSISCDESNKLRDNEEKDLEMRAPFIPIDDDYLLNDFSYSNLDDFFDWISSSDANNPNLTSKNKSNESWDLPYQHQNDKIHNNKNKPDPISKPGGCLEALLQNDELICNLKNKMYSSNQILNKEQVLESAPTAIMQNGNINSNKNTDVDFSTFIPENKSSSMKRKNSNIFVYTTMSNTGEKKIKNLILTPEIPNKINESNPAASIHHFVLTKKNELIPKVTFVNQQPQQTFKVPKRMMNQEFGTRQTLSSNVALNSNNLSESMKENVFKKPRSDSVKNFSSNSVLLNLLVNGADLSNGYELAHPSYNQSNNQQKTEDILVSTCLTPRTMIENL